MHARIALCPGDGIGPEVLEEARKVLEATAEHFGHRFTATEHLLGGAALDFTGSPLPTETLAACSSAAAVLVGAVGGPKWALTSAELRPEQGIAQLRRQLGLWAHLHEITAHQGLREQLPLRAENATDISMLWVTELADDGAADRGRLLELAARLAAARSGKLTAIEAPSAESAPRLAELAQRFPRLRVETLPAAAMARRLVQHGAQLDVLVAERELGALFAEQATALYGAAKLAPTASLGDGPRGLYGPAHGPASAIAGRSAANPVAAILSVAMMFRYTFGLEREAQAIERAVEYALLDGCRTAELGGTLTTRAMGAAIRGRLDDAVDEPMASMLTRAF